MFDITDLWLLHMFKILTSCIDEDTVDKVRIVVNTTTALSEILSISK